MFNLLTNNSTYRRLFECFMKLAKSDLQKEAIMQIMVNGEYRGFKINSMLSNEKYNERAEIKRRITFCEIVLHDEGLFLYLANNGLNVFHGTKIDSLQTILINGIMCSSKLNENDIQLKTGEERNQQEILGTTNKKRNFVSLTDDFDTSVSYAGFAYEEQTQYAKKYYGMDLEVNNEIPIIICFNGTDIEQKYKELLLIVESTCNEIGIGSAISPLDIKCIITSYDKIEYVKSIVSKYGIDVLGYNHNDRYEKRFFDKKGKFYYIVGSKIEIDEQEFEKVKEANKNNQDSIKEKFSVNDVQNIEQLSEDSSTTFASNKKMDIVFYLLEQYNNGIPYVPITANDLITMYNVNESVAYELALEINEMLKKYIQEKESRKGNSTLGVLDGFEEEINSIDGKNR